MPQVHALFEIKSTELLHIHSCSRYLIPHQQTVGIQWTQRLQFCRSGRRPVSQSAGIRIRYSSKCPQTHHVSVLVDLVVVGDLCDLLDEVAGLVEHAGDLLDQLEGELAGRRGAVNRVWKMEP